LQRGVARVTHRELPCIALALPAIDDEARAPATRRCARCSFAKADDCDVTEIMNGHLLDQRGRALRRARIANPRVARHRRAGRIPCAQFKGRIEDCIERRGVLGVRPRNEVPLEAGKQLDEPRDRGDSAGRRRRLRESGCAGACRERHDDEAKFHAASSGKAGRTFGRRDVPMRRTNVQCRSCRSDQNVIEQ
jgi:hypothetical protein